MSKDRPTAIVTGAFSGIGAVYADRLAARGNNLLVVARRRNRLDILAERLRAAHGCEDIVVAADLAKKDDLARVETFVHEAPNLGTLANCAGLGDWDPGRRLTRK